MNATEPLQTLFDLEIVREVLSDILSGDKNKARKINAIMRQFKYETDLHGNAGRAEEILQYALTSSHK